MPAATSASTASAGSKTNARSLRAPSPLTSPPTIGVKGEPETKRAMSAMSSQRETGTAKVFVMLCRSKRPPPSRKSSM
jgi:hypothetical protein